MTDIDQLRADLRLTAEREGWTQKDVTEIGNEIKRHIAEGDEAALAGWAKQLSFWRELITRTGIECRAFEQAVWAANPGRNRGPSGS